MAEGLSDATRQRWHLDRVSCMACVRALVPIPELNIFSYRDAGTNQRFTWDVAVAERIVRGQIQANPSRPPHQVDTGLLDHWLSQYAGRATPAHPWHLPEHVLFQPGIAAPVRLQAGVTLMALIDGNARAWRARYDNRPFFTYVLTEAESLAALAAAQAHDDRDQSALPDDVTTRLVRANDLSFTGRVERATSVPSLQSRIACAAACAVVVGRTDQPLVRVGDATGIDALVRAMLPDHRPYRTRSQTTRHLAQRAMLLATDCARAQGLLVAFPDRPCPSQLRPTPDSNAAFRGTGSGPWATTALALGRSATTLIYLPQPISVPEDWPLVALGGGWWSSL